MQIDENEPVAGMAEIVPPDAPAGGPQWPPPAFEHHAGPQSFKFDFVLLLDALSKITHVGGSPGEAAPVEQFAGGLDAHFLDQCLAQGTDEVSRRPQQPPTINVVNGAAARIEGEELLGAKMVVLVWLRAEHDAQMVAHDIVGTSRAQLPVQHFAGDFRRTSKLHRHGILNMNVLRTTVPVGPRTFDGLSCPVDTFFHKPCRLPRL